MLGCFVEVEKKTAFLKGFKINSFLFPRLIPHASLSSREKMSRREIEQDPCQRSKWLSGTSASPPGTDTNWHAAAPAALHYCQRANY